MVMVWLEGGQGEVRGACPPPNPQHHKLPHLDPPPPQPPQFAPPGPPPPNRPSRSPPPPPKPLLDPPHSPLLEPPIPCPPPPPPLPKCRPTVSWGGSWRPEPRGRPPGGTKGARKFVRPMGGSKNCFPPEVCILKMVSFLWRMQMWMRHIKRKSRAPPPANPPRSTNWHTHSAFMPPPPPT